MKRLTLTFCLFLIALSVGARGIREEHNLAGDKARTSYAFGMIVGSDLVEAGLAIDYTAFTEGLRDAMEQRQTILDRDQALEIVQNAFESALFLQMAELQEKEMRFLAENAMREGIHLTESGLQYMILEEGNGPRPSSGDTVLVHYEGSLTDGVIFDSSYQNGRPEEIPLDMVIPGWGEAIQLMNKGSKYRVYIPSHLAYGESGAGHIIPPFSTLVFTIELFDIVT
jgi:FKBP-type peptidyl-prolyl cis-trans isomerase